VVAIKRFASAQLIQAAMNVEKIPPMVFDFR